MLLKINLAKLERCLIGDSTIFSIFCSRIALFCVCVCVRFFFSAIFHVRTCIRAYRYLSQYKRLCRFVGTANKMATQPMLRVGHYRIYSSKIALWRGYQLLFVPWVNTKELFSMYLVAATIKKTQKSSKSLSWKNVSTLQNQFSFSSMNWRCKEHLDKSLTQTLHKLAIRASENFVKLWKRASNRNC